jgi:CRISPR-associated RAMP protein (TIGR02581 family)
MVKRHQRNGVLDDAKFTEELFFHSCTACRLFGSPWLASRVYFQDAMLINGDDLLRLTEVRDGVGIDRDLGSAKRGIKFDFEVVPTKAKFGVRIIAENMEDWEMGLFLLSLRAMEEGELPLGGKTTRGLGWCQLQGLKVERITSADLLSYLQGNSPSEADPQNFVRVFLQGLSQGVTAMHKCLWNALEIEFTLVPKSPLLIKSGRLSPNPFLPDMQFVRTLIGGMETVYIPDSSIKGVFRGFTEKVLRTLDVQEVDGGQVCEPFADNACGRRLGEEKDSARVYRQSCHACKLYGNTRLWGRLSFSDLFPNKEVVTETRYGVAISRLTNAVAQGPFQMEIVVSGEFMGKLRLENFEVWQLGLLALTIKGINDGLVKVGFGKNRGFGKVEISVTRVVVDLAKIGHDMSPSELWGVGKFINRGEEREKYGLTPDDFLTDLPDTEATDLGIFVRRTYDAERWHRVAEKAIEHSPNALGVAK